MQNDTPDNTEQDMQDDAGLPEELANHPACLALQKKAASAEEKAKQYWERLLRMQAESDNVSKRVERDISNAHKYALEKFANELLPIVDSLELCLTSVPKDMQEAAQSVIEGVDLTLKMFYQAMEKFGIKQVYPLNEVFNPEFSQAISMQYEPDAKVGTVLSVLQKGYTLNNRLLRPALVVVAKAEQN